MTHPLKSLDKDGFLVVQNEAIDAIESIGVEIDVEALANVLFNIFWKEHANELNEENTKIVMNSMVLTAQAIANSPEVLRLVRMTKEEK